MINLYTSLILSIIVQFVTGFIEFGSLFINVSNEFTILKQLLLMEVVVQFIESAFYLYWYFNFTNITNITPKRYLDWSLTTPTMLVTLIFYLVFLKYKENNTSYKLNFVDLFHQESNTIIIVLLLNWLMLLFGYLGETKFIPVLLGVSLGFIPFLIYYYIIYQKYALLTDDGFKIFAYFFIVWSLYGIVAVLPYKIKNMFYNILDLFAKNFFGIFLSYVLFKNKYV